MVQPAGTGMSVVSGSELSAGIAPATLKLTRGGQIRICSRTNVTINATGPGLILGVGAGAIEIDYRVGSDASDLLVTPDFNVRLAGPSTYHFALGVSSRGDTCFKPLPGNAAGVVLSEMISADSFGTSPNEAMGFVGGKLAGRATLKEECGCAEAAAPPVLRAETQPAPNRNGTDSTTVMPAPVPPNRDLTAPLPPARPGEAPVVVSTPFVFSAEGRPTSTARLQFSSLPNAFFLQDALEPAVLVEKRAQVSPQENRKEPAEQAKRKKEEPKKEGKGFMARLKGFFGSLFRR